MRITVDTEKKEIILLEDTNITDLHEFIERIDSLFEYTIVLPEIKYYNSNPSLLPFWRDLNLKKRKQEPLDGYKVNDYPFSEPVYCHPPVTSVHIPTVGVDRVDGYANSSDLSDK